MVLTKFRAENFFAKRSRCLFAMPRNDLCGFDVSVSDLKTNLEKFEALI